MYLRTKLFHYKDPYDLERTEGYFLNQVKENILFQIHGCKEYERMLNREGFCITDLKTMSDLWKIPVIPTLYFKSHHLFSMEKSQYVIRALSSGTKGKQSEIRIDKESLSHGLTMAYRMFSYHGLISAVPVHYVVLGYEPSRDNLMGAVKTAAGATWFAPSLSKVYALTKKGDDYCNNVKGIVRNLLHYEKGAFPIRLIGFPGYMAFLLTELEKRGIRMRLPSGSRVMLGGGWKQFSGSELPMDDLYGRIQAVLGIPKDHCSEFFSAVEHPVMYCSCSNGHFHVPIYSRVIVRDCWTLEPLKYGETGLLSFVTPIMKGMPLVSVVTDDLAVLHEPSSCGCNISSPWFELKGRAQVDEIMTCAADAAARLRGEL